MPMNHILLTENIAYACTRKPCEVGRGQETAFRWISPRGEVRDYTYQEVEEQSNRLAAALRRLGIAAGETVSVFLPRAPELMFAFFGILKNESLACVLFSTFGENALEDRLQNSQTRVVITKQSLLKKIATIWDRLPDLRYVLLVDADEPEGEQVLSLPQLMAREEPSFDFSPSVLAETPAFLQFTSGSTGKPKGALHVHGALASMTTSFEEVMQLEPGEVYWCTADPAWITGITYGMVAPLALGVRQVQFGGSYRAAAWLTILQQQAVNVWYTAPTALRMLMQEEPELFQAYDFSCLKRIYSVGEPLNPEIYHWGKQAFGREIYDTWFQSETGSIMIANRPGLTVKPGSMGKPLSGILPSVRDEQMQPRPIGEQGHLCLTAGWPSMFRTYWRKQTLYDEKFQGNFYVTGDLAWQDEEGYYWYVSRSDDVINTGGHLVGPFEVESALLEVAEVADVAVIGAPDPILHQKIVAFVRLKSGTEWSRALELKCRVAVSNRVSTSAIPQEFRVVELIPKNKSGKILRRVLKAQYEGKDPGDLSTMEEA